MELKIEYLPVSELMPSDKNARIHTHDQIDQIAESIEKFGNCDPIGVWTDGDGNFEVVEGHGRLAALKKLGREEAPVIFLDHLGEDEKRAYAILHNKLTDNSEFDFAILEQELASMPDFDWEGFGFDASSFEQASGFFNEEELDDFSDRETVVVSINCGNIESFRMIEDDLKSLSDSIGASFSVKMQ